MSTQYLGGFITKTPVVPAGPSETGAASGIWTVDQALQYVKQGIWPTQGVTLNYIEQVFSSYLYTGNSSASTYYQYVPTGPQFLNGAVNNTLIQMVGDTLTDSSPNPSTVTVPSGYESPYVSSAQAKFGSYSIYFPATGSVLQMVPPAQFTPVAINGSAFCVQMWVYLPTSNADKTFFEAKVGNTTGFTLQTNGSGVMRMIASNPTFSTYTLGTGPGVGAWAHIALTCAGFTGTTNTFTYYLNGVNQGSVAFTPHSSSTFYPCYIYQIGSQNNGSLSDAYIDDFKVQAGSQVYTTNFTPPTAPLALDTKITGKGGLFWAKSRSVASSHMLFDTSRGSSYLISNQTTAAQNVNSNYTFNGFNAQGATVLTQTMGGTGTAALNTGGTTYGTWSFTEQPKFFDIVSYTGNGAVRTLAHNLGSVPGCVLIKCTSLGGTDWMVFHRSASTGYFYLNTTAALMTAGAATFFGDGSSVVAPDATSIYLGSGDSQINQTSATYVAYLFAHDAGGFGLTGTDNVISCGSYTGNGSTSNQINLGYEPQWLLVKRSSTAGNDWYMFDNMRGVYTSLDDYLLRANTTAAEVSAPRLDFNANGFSPTSADAEFNASGSTYIYVAVRRGPMKTPTVGTSVFGINARTGTGANATVTGGQTDDLAVIRSRDAGQAALWTARFTGKNYLQSDSTAAESTAGITILQANPWDVMDGIKVGSTSSITNASGAAYINYLFRRAPGFFDVVCYAGIDPAIRHNLGVTPEMYIVKVRSASGVTARWYVYHTGYNTASNYIALNSSAAIAAATIWGSGPTATVIGATGGTGVNSAGQTYIAYLFATLAGVSKVGSYTGTGALQTINCGFTTGARFVLIKRTDSTGEWYTYDTARGMSSGTDPYFLMNSSAAETTGTNYVDTDTTGFKVTAAAPADLNAVGGNYIFLAIA